MPTIVLCHTTKGRVLILWKILFFGTTVLHKAEYQAAKGIFEFIRDMRDTFVNSLLHAALHDPRILLITADLGFKVFDEFIEKCPHQFLNVGICEQAMIRSLWFCSRVEKFLLFHW